MIPLLLSRVVHVTGFAIDSPKITLLEPPTVPGTTPL
jgi:hypothetical protein